MEKLFTEVHAPDLVETTIFDQLENKIVTQVTYDNTDVLAANAEARALALEFGQYKGNLVHVGSLHMGDVTRLQNLGYDVLSSDPDETRRALCYIQENEPHLLTVTGKPFAKHRNTWQ